MKVKQNQIIKIKKMIKKILKQMRIKEKLIKNIEMK